MTDEPARWLPAGYANWDDFLAAVLQRGLREAHAPGDLSKWQQGTAFPLQIDHPLFSRIAPAARLFGIHLAGGTGPQSDSGDSTTVKQVGHSFGPSERFTADLSDPDNTTLNLVLGQSGDPASPWYMDQLENLASRHNLFVAIHTCGHSCHHHAYANIDTAMRITEC